jgi:hypothetical protein
LLQGGDGSDTLVGGAGADVLTGGAGADRFVFAYEQLGVSADYISDFLAGSGSTVDKIDLDAIHAGNLATPVPSWPAAQYPFSLGYIRMQQDGADVVIGYDRDGYGNEHSFKPVVTLASVDANTLTPDNFTTAAQNFGFQRNGAQIAIKSTDAATVQYDVRLWGGMPSSAVTVVLSSAQSSIELGRVSYTPADWAATKSVTVPLAGSVRNLDGLSVRIESSDVAYQGSGMVLGVVDGALLAERIQITRPELSVFAARASNRSLEISGTGLGLAGALPATLDLVPVSGAGPATTASVSIVDSSRVKLALNSLSSAWDGSTEYIAMGINASGQSVRIKLIVEQSETYAATVDGQNHQIAEGTGQNGLLTALIQLDKVALSDLAMNWQVIPAGTRAASASDFPGGVFPSGQVLIKAGQSKASLAIPILGDSTQESDETFAVVLSNASSSVVNAASSPVFKISNDDKSSLLGEVRYWAGNRLIDDVGITLIKKVQSANPVDAVMIRNVSLDAATGLMRAEVWYEGSTAVSNLNLSFLKNGDPQFVATLNGTALNPSQWSLFVNDTTDRYQFSGISLQSLSAPFKIMDVQASMPGSGQGIVLEGGVVGSQVVQETPLMTSLSSAIDQGQVDLGLVNGTYLAGLSKASLPTLAREAIDSRDALMVLKMATSALPAGQIATGHQYLAADVDQNGVVQVKDAWAIARYSIGLTGSAQAGNWVFLDSRTDVSGLSAQQAQMPAAPTLDISAGGASNVAFVGIALGDADGSLGQHSYLS